MESTNQDHLSDGLLENYSLGRFQKPKSASVEKHILVCDFCLARLEAIEPVNFVHFTSDGPIYSRATRLATGKVIARHWGKSLDDSKLCQDVANAKRCLEESFAEMFPEHACDDRCGPTQEQSNL